MSIINIEKPSKERNSLNTIMAALSASGNTFSGRGLDTIIGMERGKISTHGFKTFKKVDGKHKLSLKSRSNRAKAARKAKAA